MEDTLRDILAFVTTVFAVTTMLSMGLNLTVAQILRPLSSVRLVALALVLNFVLVPLLALGLDFVLGLSDDIRTGLLLISTAAGAPLVPKLAQMARGSVAAAVGVVGLLVLATVVYMPIVLPLLLPSGTEVNAFGIASALTLQMLLPLAAGLGINGYFDSVARTWQPRVALLSNIALVGLLLLTLGLNISAVLGLFGSGAITAVIILIVVGLCAGYVLGEPGKGTRPALAFSAGQRNLAAAFIVGTASFVDQDDVMATLASAGVLSMLILIPTAIVMGRRRESAEQRVAADAESAPPDTERRKAA